MLLLVCDSLNLSLHFHQHLLLFIFFLYRQSTGCELISFYLYPMIVMVTDSFRVFFKICISQKDTVHHLSLTFAITLSIFYPRVMVIIVDPSLLPMTENEAANCASKIR